MIINFLANSICGKFNLKKYKFASLRTRTVETEDSTLHAVRAACVCARALIAVRARLLCFKGISAGNNNNYKPTPNNGVGQGRHMSPNMSPHPQQQQAPPRQMSPPHSPASSQGSMLKVPSSPRHQAEPLRLSHEQVI